ncbi:MAG: hypothetical protein JRH20_10645 [Deltaproteobacteria bacterium]|nr:hypothetical protein [Deltaproteobacteria bacterium]
MFRGMSLETHQRCSAGWVLALCVTWVIGGCAEGDGALQLKDASVQPVDSALVVLDSALPSSDGEPHSADIQPPDELSVFMDAGAGDTTPARFRCTQVIGYSQVRQWYADGNFESYVDATRWQLLWNGGAGVDLWQDPTYLGWSNALVSPCDQRADAPDRVLLSISGPYGDDEAAWAAGIRAAIGTIRSKIPTATRIVLQPVVGGPNHQTCLIDGSEVRASWQHAHVDHAIAEVVGDAADIVAGMSPEVGDCNEYGDAKGHFTRAGSEAAGKAIGEFYAAEEVMP